jgi:subtilase family serine protease
VSATATVLFNWSVSGVQPGALSLSFLVDPDDYIAEENELNNVLTTTVTVQPADVADLAILGVTFSPVEPRVGDSVTISVLVSNDGTKASTDAPLEVRLGNNRIGQKSIGVLAVGAQTTVEVVWPATEITEPIKYALRVELDPDNVNRETMLDNNVMQVNLTFLKAPAPVLGNLTVTSSAEKVTDGKEVTVTVRLENSGDDAATVRIVLKDGTVEVGSRQAVIVPAGGSKEEMFVVLLKGTGEHVLTATVYKGTDIVKDPSGKDLVVSATVKVEKKDNGPGFGATAAVMAVMLALAVLALVATRRRK